MPKVHHSEIHITLMVFKFHNGCSWGTYFAYRAINLTSRCDNRNICPKTNIVKRKNKSIVFPNKHKVSPRGSSRDKLIKVHQVPARSISAKPPTRFIYLSTCRRQVNNTIKPTSQVRTLTILTTHDNNNIYVYIIYVCVYI